MATLFNSLTPLRGEEHAEEVFERELWRRLPGLVYPEMCLSR